VDPLSDVLRAVRLTGAYFYVVEGAPGWSVATSPARELAPQILPDAEHLVPYHVLSEGACWGGLHGEPRVHMQPGDVLMFPRGDAHVMSSQPRDVVAPALETRAPGPYPSTVRVGSGQHDTVLMSGFLGCDVGPFNPLLAALPRMLHLPNIGGGWLSTLPEQVLREWRNPKPGSATVLTRLAEVMFIEVLRQHIATIGIEQRGWLAGLRDPLVGAVLSALHARPAHPWTLHELASEVAASRSVLAERFGEVVGMPPIQYLMHWRLQLAADQLRRTRAKVSAIAAKVGYNSEAAFSRAFKRATGLSPGAYRTRQQQADGHATT
jgi:AraC-like DNA-binding protein